MGQAVEERRCHLGIAEDGRPFAESEIGRDENRGPLVEPADQVEEKLAARLGEGQISEFVENDEVHAREIFRDAALSGSTPFRLELVDEVDDVKETATGPGADAGSGNGDRQMRFASTGSAN